MGPRALRASFIIFTKNSGPIEDGLHEPVWFLPSVGGPALLHLLIGLPSHLRSLSAGVGYTVTSSWEACWWVKLVALHFLPVPKHTESQLLETFGDLEMG